MKQSKSVLKKRDELKIWVILVIQIHADINQINELLFKIAKIYKVKELIRKKLNICQKNKKEYLKANNGELQIC